MRGECGVCSIADDGEMRPQVKRECRLRLKRGLEKLPAGGLITCQTGIREQVNSALAQGAA